MRLRIANYARNLRCEALESRNMLATFTVTSVIDSANLPGEVTLREAINLANDNDNPSVIDNIRFDSGVFNDVIDLSSALPQITKPVDIEVDPFFPFSSDRVTIDGTGISGPGLEFNIGTNDSASLMFVQGLIISNFTGDGILVSDLPPDVTLTLRQNTFDSNSGAGVRVSLTSNAGINGLDLTENTITNNSIGIRIDDLEDTPFSIFANTIGTDGTSTNDGNSSHGIQITNSSPLSSQQARVFSNTISGNGGDGVRLVDSTWSNVLSGIDTNEIGLNEDRDGIIGNGGNGVTLDNSRVALNSNEIGGNAGGGVVIDNSDLVSLSANRIGTTLSDPSTDFGNVGNGIAIVNGAMNSLISGNFISFNGQDGVAISGSTTDEHEITQNTFRLNAGSPIDLLGIDGNDPNIAGDADTGPNDLLNHPEIDESSISLSSGTWTIPYAYSFDLSTNYRFEFYRFDTVTRQYTFVGSDTGSGTSGSGSINLTDGTGSSQITIGNQLSVLAVRTSGSTAQNTSELSPLTAPLVGGDTTPPKVTDVRLDGSGWAIDPVSFADDVLPNGPQLAPIFHSGVDVIEIEFDEAVNVVAGNLQVRGNGGTILTPNSVTMSPGNDVARFQFASALPAGKYEVELSTDVTDLSGLNLDAETGEINQDNGTEDQFGDDPNVSFATVGDGSPGAPDNAFDFRFSLLPGDYDSSGFVDATDDAITNVDGNGDGVINSADVATTLAGSNNALIASVRRADFDGNEMVDRFDYMRWFETFGSSVAPGTSADANANGSIDAADFPIWQDNFGAFSAWQGGAGGIGTGSGLPIVQFGVAPSVQNVTISGSNSNHVPFSMSSVDGSGAQLVTVPVGSADTIAVQFSEDVNIQTDNLRISGLANASLPDVIEFSYDNFTQTATWRFSGLLASDQYLISLSDAVTDVEGNFLDGEWTNPASIFVASGVGVSEFPSGDGTAGGDFNFVFTLLGGDFTLDNVVSGLDLSTLGDNLNDPNIIALFTDGDADGDNDVDLFDLISFSSTFNINLQSVSVLADLNGDDVVDDLDGDILYDNWENNLANPTLADGDLDQDGDIDLDDLDVLFAQHGVQLDTVG